MAKILIRILFLAGVVGGGFYMARDAEIVNKIEEKKEQFQGSVKGITNTVNDQTQELTNRGQEVGEHVSNVLGSYIEPTEDKQQNSQSSQEENQNNSSAESDEPNKPIYEETLDYGRYLYCQQVVKDYQQQHP